MTVNPAQDLSALHGVGAHGFINMYATGSQDGPNDRSWRSSVSSIYPSLTGSSTSPTKNNGGCWQGVNLTLHEENLRVGIAAQIPADFAGYVAYDLEGAPPIMGRLTWTAYNNSCSPASDFDAASKAWYQLTTKVLKEMRPKAKFGVYGHPINGYGNCAWYASDTCHESQLSIMRAAVESPELDWFWELVDFLSPTIYIKKKQYEPDAEERIRSIINETARIARAHGKPIVPYAGPNYFGDGGWPTLDAAATRAEFLVPFEFDEVAAVAVWGDSDTSPGPVAIQKYIDETFAPVINDFTASACKCAAERCGGRGRCSGPAMERCACRAGFAGDRCEVEVPPESKYVEVEAEAAVSRQHRSLESTGGGVLCPDKVSSCPAGTSCSGLSSNIFGCCPTPNATLCDAAVCCPSGYLCGKVPLTAPHYNVCVKA